MAKYTEEQLFAKLERADAAGDAEAAKVIADEIRSLRSQPAQVKSPRAGVRGGAPIGASQSSNRPMPKPVKQKPLTWVGYDESKPIQENLDAKFAQDYAGFDSLGHRLMDLPIGIGQLTANAAALLPSETLKENADTYNKFVAQREQEYQDRNPDNLATYTGATLGMALPWMTGTGINVMNKAASAGRIVPQTNGILRLPARAGRITVGGGAQGALAGAVAPDTSGEFSEKGDQILSTAAVSAATPLAALGTAKVIDGVSSAINYARNPQGVAGRKLAEWYGSDPETIAALRNAPQYFPDEQISAAQALQNPRAFAVEKAMGNNPQFKIMAEEARNANNAGRVAVVEGIAKTPAERKAAIAARKAATDPFYKEFVNPVSPYTRYNNASNALNAVKGKRMSAEDFGALDEAGKIVRSVRDGRRTEEEAAELLSQITVKSATAQKALDQATSAVNKNMIDVGRIEKQLQSLTLNPSGTVRSFASEQLALIGKLKEQYGGNIPVANLQGIQQQLSREFNSASARNGFDNSGQYVLGKLNSRFNSSLDRAVPGYRDNARTYAQLSQPINDMDAGQAILSRGDGRVLNTAGEAPLSLADLNRAISDDGKARYGMSDSSLAKLIGLRDSMSREGTTIRSSGSDTAYNLNADGWLARLIYGGQGRRGAAEYALPIAGGYLGDIVGGGAGLAVGSAAGTGLSMALNNRVQAINSRIATEAARGVYDSRVAADMIEQTLKENPNQARALLERFPYWRELIAKP